MLIAENIHKKYKRPVLDGVGLTVGAFGSEIIGLAGENGSGKSTLLSVMTGILRPNSGRVTVEGDDIFKNPRVLRKWIGYVPQESSLFDQLSALDNIKLWASAYGADWRAALPILFPEETNTQIRREFLRKKCGKLSGGMKKRLSIAISSMHSPKYLIMDEPSAGLDIGFKQRLADTMRTMKQNGQCVVFSTHHPDELLLCDRIYVLRDGVFVFMGEPSELGTERTMTENLFKLTKR